MKHDAVLNSIWHPFQIEFESASTRFSIKVSPLTIKASFDGCPHHAYIHCDRICSELNSKSMILK